MKNAVILHGTGETDQSFWFPYTKHALEKKDYSVSIPLLPNPDYPDLKTWLPVALEETFTSETVLIGHSTGGPLQLSVLENINIPIKQTILVAGYARPKGKEKLPEKILQDVYDWEKIKRNTGELIFINSDNDPWGCNDIEGRYMLDNLEGKLIIMKGEGHMGSNTYKQPYKKFPFLLKLID